MPSLMPLRIPSGWRIECNNFFEGEQLMWNDIFQAQGSFYGHELIIDIGCYKTDGTISVMLIMDGDWDKPMAELRSKSKRLIASSAEKWMREDFWGKYIPQK